MDAFKLSFFECKKKVAQTFLGLDMSKIVDVEPEGEDEGGEGEEATEEVAKIEVEPVGIEEVPEVTTRVEGAEIIEVVIGTLEAYLSPIPQELAMGPKE